MLKRGKIALLVVAVLCLALLVSRIRLQDLNRAVAEMSLRFAALGALAAGVSYLLKAVRYQGFLGTSAGFRKMFGITIAHNVVAQIFPMRLGDVSYVVMLDRAGLAPVGHGLTSLLLCRFADLLVLWLMFMFSVPIVSARYPALFWSGMALGGLLFAGVAFLAVVLVRGASMVATTRRFIERAGLLRWHWVRRAWEEIEKGAAPLRTMRRWRTLLVFCLVSLGIWAASTYWNYCAWRAVGISLTVPQVVFITAFSYLITLLPIFLFAGIGTADAIRAGVLLMFGIPSGVAALSSLANRVLETAYLLLLSGLALVVMKGRWRRFTEEMEYAADD